jgi:heme ABC exporter ATP-binding subunit CcmA
MTAISCQNINKSYGHYEVLRNLNLTIQEGECFSLFGPNGAGKTTLLKILATLQRPSEGRYEILGLDGLKEKEAIRSNMMFLAHGAHLYDDLDARENLEFALALRGHTPAGRDMKLALDRVGIGAFAEMKVRNYSAGMKKRLALAKAMLAKPKVLLLDEPFTALDTAGTEIMREYIRERLSDNGTVLMSTHDHEKARPITSRAGMLKQGTLQEISIETLKSDAIF